MFHGNLHVGKLPPGFASCRAVKAKNLHHRVLIGTDTPGGTGIVPRGILREIAFISSVGEIAPEKTICMATGNVGRAHDLNLGILEEGRPADLVLMHKITGSVAKTRWIRSPKAICRAFPT